MCDERGTRWPQTQTAEAMSMRDGARSVRRAVGRSGARGAITAAQDRRAGGEKTQLHRECADQREKLRELRLVSGFLRLRPRALPDLSRQAGQGLRLVRVVGATDLSESSAALALRPRSAGAASASI